MGRGRVSRLSAAQRRDLWARWKAGEGTAQIAQALAMSGSEVRRITRATGGFVPREQHRSVRCLSGADREEISRGLCRGESMRQIAARLGRPPSTVSREIARNGGAASYRATVADQRAWHQARRPKACRLARHRQLREVVAAQLEEDLSPEQIAGWLKMEFPDNEEMRISHETIYRSLFIQARGVLKKELMAHLRTQRLQRRAKAAAPRRGHGPIPDPISISQRPAKIEDRAVPGHWEGDLIEGRANTFVATLVERHSRFVLLVKVKSKSPGDVVPALIAQMQSLPEQLQGSLTWDRGAELAAHKTFTLATNMKVYFCDPKSPWQRGSNENTNGLLRQYLKKGAFLNSYSQEDLDAIAAKLNRRPRKTLGFRTPAATLEAAVASTG
jgi:IS30 family transposase